MAEIGSTPLINTLEHYLALTTASQGRTTSNMANVDTPGYHAREIDFRAEMQRAQTRAAQAGFENAGFDNNGFESSGGDFNNSGPALSPVSHEVPGLLERPDGNNVNLDREGLALSESQLQYQVGVQLVKHEFHKLFSAINGGN